MAERRWTKDQAAAIAERNRTLLVSAAAGSGKTATLTERIIRTLTDENSEAELSRMLIVTFTRAAAAELRTRISLALSAAIAAGGRTAHLSRQLLYLPSAKISTIDSFCLDLVRAHAVSLGLSPAFRLADPAENKLLCDSLMKRLLEDCYDGVCEGVDASAFSSLVDALTGTRGDGAFAEILLTLYEKAQGFANSHRLFSEMADTLAAAASQAPFETPWGDAIRERTLRALSPLRESYRALLPRVACDPLVGAKYPPVLHADIEAIEAVLSHLPLGYGATRAALLSVEKKSIPAVRGVKDLAVADEAKAAHAALHKTLSSLYTDYYVYSEEEWAPLCRALCDHVSLLGRLFTAFSDRVDAEKRRRSILTFSDLSRYALALLCEEDGGKTPLARELSRDFDYVYVDEYQDVNEVQHRIFEALSHPRARFMVGDVKQSIYGFRGAQPEIFAALRTAFPPLSDGCGDAASLSLSANFRSAPAILDFVNLVFGRHMESGLGAHIGYDPACDRLIAGTDTESTRVTLALFEKAPDPAEDGEGATPPAAGAEGADAAPAHPMAEEDYVAAEIARLLREGVKKKDGTPLLPADIAILTRNSAAADRFADALARVGISCERAAKRGFFLNPEILLALSLLNVIDNPRRDVYLAGLLRSPLFGFSMDELIAIRRETAADPAMRDASFLEALVAYVSQNPHFEKGTRFLSDLARYRRMAEGRSVDTLIWQLYRETGLLSIAGADKEGDPAARRANLMLLYDYARRFEGSSYRGLYNFIAYINEAIERGQSIEEVRAQSERPDTVRIMTMHQSKGLEFPVCFVSDCGHGFNLTDTTAPLLFDRTYGLSLKLRDESGYARLKNPIYNLLSVVTAERAIEEELRVLYVALTRPKERLYVSATVKDVAALFEKAPPATTPLTAQVTYACRNYADLIVAAAGCDSTYDILVNGHAFHPATPAPDAQEAPEGVPENAQNALENAQKAPAIATKTQETAPESAQKSQEPVPEGASEGAQKDADAAVRACQEELVRRFAFVYPDRYLSSIPGKLSVSRLYPTALDGTEEESLPLTLTSPAPAALAAITTIADDGTRVFREAPEWAEADPDPDTETASKAAPEATGESTTAPDRPTVPRFLGGEKDKAARAGTATHLFMQFCDFRALLENGVEGELTRLVSHRFLSAEDAALVRLDEVAVFTRSPLFAALSQASSRVYRELRFHARFSAAAFTADPEKRVAYADERVLVQGVMDAVLLTADGELWLIDYKTDRLSAYEKRNRAVGEEKLRARHALQLSYYTAACREIFGRTPDRVLIYSLALGDTVDLPPVLPDGI